MLSHQEQKEERISSGVNEHESGIHSCLLDSRTENRHFDLTCEARKLKKVSSTAVMIPTRRKNHINLEEEKSEVSTEWSLVHGFHKSNSETPETSDNVDLSLTLKNTTQVSTELMLYDDSWPTTAKEPFNVADRNKEEVMGYSKIARMKHYRHWEELEERLKRVSTKLTLYLDPWNIKKKLTRSDLGHLSRLLVPTSLIDEYVLRLMSSDQINEVHSREGARVMVWDQDTGSQHKLVLKKWTTSQCYVLIDGWTQKFVNRRNLNVGDQIGLYWDPHHSRFNFSVLRRSIM